MPLTERDPHRLRHPLRPGLCHRRGAGSDAALLRAGRPAAGDGDLPLWGMGQMTAQDRSLSAYGFLPGDTPILPPPT
ncbi:MAG: hypothetical protein R2856_23320 [Caldilineaceae bacterium]